MSLENMTCELVALEGAKNVRDLGGYPTRDGRVTRKGCFYRGASLGGLSGKGRKTLADLVDCVIDLRSRREVRQQPDGLEGLGLCCLHVPMLDEVNSRLADGSEELHFPKTMAELYRKLLDFGGEGFRKVFEAFAGERERFLFHCTAGKDRTGVTAMLLLELAGVEREAIVRDYSHSQELLGPLPKQLAELPFDIPAYVLESRPETMEETLEHLEQVYGSAAGYLNHIGIGERQQAVIKDRLLGRQSGK